MTRLVAAVVSALLVVGCAPKVDGVAVPEPRKLDCNLIFPGPLEDTP